jgi:phthiodiolone/phenolphthiodiolone dimycocerosates ketoreductase
VWRKAGHDHPFGEGYRGIVDWIPSRADPGEIEGLMADVPFEVLHTAFDHGTWQQVVARIMSYQGAGLRHAVIAGLNPLVAPRTLPAYVRDLARLIRALR